MNLRDSDIDRVIQAKADAHDGPIRKAEMVNEVFEDLRQIVGVANAIDWWALRLAVQARVRVFFRREAAWLEERARREKRD